MASPGAVDREPKDGPRLMGTMPLIAFKPPHIRPARTSLKYRASPKHHNPDKEDHDCQVDHPQWVVGVQARD